ncbi:MAG TPA: Ig-like domain-containing protein, partial [Trueperaceae bacterium]|nr:Ig-like domain-containing protein [Trueperaceae bacterium]
GSFTQFRAISVADDSDVTALVTWSSSNEAVATVSNDPGTAGLVTALGAGVTTIKAESALGSGTGVITVLAGMPTVNGVVVSDMAGASIGTSNTSRNIAVGRDLSVHVAWVDGAGDVRYSRSLTAGAAFEASVLIGSASSSEVSIATSGSDHVYIAYTSTVGLVMAQSHDGGDTWLTTDLSTGVPGMLEPQLGLAVHEANVYVMVGSWEGYVLLRSEDYGASFTQVALPFGSLAFFDVLVDPRNGDVYAIGDDPTIYYSVSHDAGATFSAAQAVDPTYGVFYSDYSISQLGEIVIAGGMMEPQASLWNIDTDEWSSVPNPGTVTPQGASAAIDGANAIHIINLSEMTPGTIQLATSIDRGLTYDLITVATGTQADIAPSTFVVGSPIIYNDAGVIKYSFIPNAD